MPRSLILLPAPRTPLVSLLLLLLLGALPSLTGTAFAQERNDLLNRNAKPNRPPFFRTYTDSAALVHDANRITADFVTRVNAIHPLIDSAPRAILNTKPFLIFYSPKANLVNLPLWDQVIPEQKQFFYKLAGDESKGRRLFGLFFNGFYLPHELGHALQRFARMRENDKESASQAGPAAASPAAGPAAGPAAAKPDLYHGEYFANTIGILYWRATGRTKELRQCYRYAKKMVAQLPNPVPNGKDPVQYFNDNYEALGRDPNLYGYFQFAQFVRIYEDSSLPDFNGFVRNFLTSGSQGSR